MKYFSVGLSIGLHAYLQNHRPGFDARRSDFSRVAGVADSKRSESGGIYSAATKMFAVKSC